MWRTVIQAAVLTAVAMLLYSLHASNRQVCFEAPCFLPDQIVYFLFDEAWIIGLMAFPPALLITLGWRHLTRSRDG